MNTLAWVLILMGVLIARATVKGRIMDIGEDISDAFLAGVSGDFNGVAAVLKRTGSDASATTTGIITSRVATGVGHEDGSANLLTTALSLGGKARGYRLGATGPDYYDCSGLVYRAVQAFGYKGSRFTTDDVQGKEGFKRVSVGEVSVGDVVLWPTHHMGVVSDTGKFYSARNPDKGLGVAPIKGFRSEDPVYLKYFPPKAAGSNG